MKTYIVYNDKGIQIPVLIKAASHNAAEKKAVKKYGPGSSVSYTEV